MTQGASNQEQQDRCENAELCQNIYRQNRHSEAAFFKIFRLPAIGWAQQHIDNLCDAEDLAHDALLTVLQRLRARPLKNPSALPGFIRRTVAYTAIGFIRKQSRRRTHTIGDWPEHLSPVEDQSFSSLALAQECREVRTLVGELTQSRDRELLRMKFFEDRPKSDICETLQVSPAQFDRLFYRAKKRLRDLVEQTGDWAPGRT